MKINGNGNPYQMIKDHKDPLTRSERLEKIKKQISDDAYYPNPQDVARKMLHSSDARHNLGFDIKA